jgi:hypothetical protein
LRGRGQRQDSGLTKIQSNARTTREAGSQKLVTFGGGVAAALVTGIVMAVAMFSFKIGMIVIAALAGGQDDHHLSLT